MNGDIRPPRPTTPPQRAGVEGRGVLQRNMSPQTVPATRQASLYHDTPTRTSLPPAEFAPTDATVMPKQSSTGQEASVDASEQIDNGSSPADSGGFAAGVVPSAFAARHRSDIPDRASQAPQAEQRSPVERSEEAEQPRREQETGSQSVSPRRSAKRLAVLIIGTIIALAAICAVAVVIWYQSLLQPVAAQDTSRVRVQIVPGSTPRDIGQLLQDKKVIRSQQAFDIYTRLAGNRNDLQAGTYSLSPSQSLADIVDHIVSGKVDTFKVTFYPGSTLIDVSDTSASKKTDVQTVLRRAGFSQADIDTAFASHYDLPSLFAGRPATASLEGYIYGETYSVDSSMTAQQVLLTSMTQLDRVIKDNDLVAKFNAQGLTLYQGITLASIVQSEMGSHKADMPQVAQIFLKRYKAGMPLGSDVTAYYGADRAHKTRAVATDTPYNTRIHAGLPPGPISSPGLAALLAVAQPAAGDYLFFLSGDDGVTYYAQTDAQHQKNIIDHCKVGCAVQ